MYTVCKKTIFFLILNRLYGQYLAETQSENLTDLINKYFKKSLTLLQKINKDRINSKLEKNEMDKFELDNNLKTYSAIAKYVDNNYTQVNNYNLLIKLFKVIIKK